MLEPSCDEPVCVKLVEELRAECEDQPNQASVKAREEPYKLGCGVLRMPIEDTSNARNKTGFIFFNNKKPDTLFT